MPTTRVGRFGKRDNGLSQEEIVQRQNEDVDFMSDKPAQPKAQTRKPVEPNASNEDTRIMTTQNNKNAKVNEQANRTFARANVPSIRDIVSEDDMKVALTGLAEIEGTEVVITSVRFGKGDNFDAEREVAYMDSYNALTQENYILVSSAYYVVRQLHVVIDKGMLPFQATPALVKDDKGKKRWELQ